jgi:hypothetical protein
MKKVYVVFRQMDDEYSEIVFQAVCETEAKAKAYIDECIAEELADEIPEEVEYLKSIDEYDPTYGYYYKEQELH